MHGAFDRGSDADLNHPPWLYQPLQDRVIKDRAVGKSLPEILGPGIDMGIEMDEGRWTASLRQRAKEREGNAVVTAERNQVLDPSGLLFDLREARRNVTKRDRKVADVGREEPPD